MVDFVEVFWNARPNVDRLRKVVGKKRYEHEAARFFQDVRAAILERLPSEVVLIRISVRTGSRSTDDLRVLRSGVGASDEVVASVRAATDLVIETTHSRLSEGAPRA